MHPYLFQTSWFSLHSENLMIILGILAGVWLVQRRSAHKGAGYQNAMLDLAIWLLPAGIVGARLWEVIFTWQEFADNPWGVLAVWKGGLSIQGSILGGLLVVVLFAWRHRFRVWELLDIIAPAVVLGQGIGRLGCLLSGDAFGRPVSEVPWLPPAFGVVYAPGTPAWSIYGNTPLIPAEGFEMGLDFLIMALLLGYKPRRNVPGRTILLYAVLYSAARFGLEFLRADSLQAGGFKVAQLLSLVVIVACSGLLIHRCRSLHQLKKATG